MALLIAGLVYSAQDFFIVSAAIHKAWRTLAEGKREEAGGIQALRLPTLTMQAQGIRTDETKLAFGTKLNQSRINAMEFNQARLNRPDSILGFGGSAVVSQPLYAGYRNTAARWAEENEVRAESASKERREQETTMDVVQAIRMSFSLSKK